MKTFSYIIILIVAVAIVAGFFIVGSPQEERLRKFDERRVQDLQNIQGQIINYWTRKAQLPTALDQLNDSISGFMIPKDPSNNNDYAYQVKDNLNFSLCAVFDRPSLDNTPMIMAPAYPMRAGFYPEQQNWQHKEGSVCFERKIDKELYKPEKR